jgi:hypothetical protein
VNTSTRDVGVAVGECCDERTPDAHVATDPAIGTADDEDRKAGSPPTCGEQAEANDDDRHALFQQGAAHRRALPSRRGRTAPARARNTGSAEVNRGRGVRRGSTSS